MLVGDYMMDTLPFNLNNMVKDAPIIIYGASTYGEIAYVALKELRLSPLYFCDRTKKGKYLGIEIIQPSQLVDFLNDNIIIASRDYFYDIKNTIMEIGCKNVFDMRELISMDLPLSKLSNIAKDMYAGRNSYINVAEHQNNEQINFHRLQYIVTERCSLRCKDCVSLMQYYQKPEDVDIDYYRESFERLLNLADNISELRIFGGEPFMNRGTYKLIERYAPLEKIASIQVYTNGTIIPDENNLHAMESDKVTLHISNYIHNEERISHLVERIKNYAIKYFVRQYDSWEDCGNLDYRNHSVKELENIFSRCVDRNCYTFFRGQFHRCPRSGFAMHLGAMPDVPNDYVDFTDKEKSDQTLREELMKLCQKTFIEACNYCDGIDYGLERTHIPAGEQVEKPLKYKRRE